MYAGAAAADFTPEPGLILQGHLSKNPSHAVLYPLEARAVVFNDNQAAICLITLDVIGIELEFTRQIRQQVSAKTGIRPDHILIATSHTHCAPAMLHSLAMTPESHFVHRVEKAAVECAIEAHRNLRPATLGLGAGSAYFNVNRRPLPGQAPFSVNFGGVVDHRARILRVDGPDDRPIAILFHFSCHPTTKVGSEGFISPDYPGVARRHIEAAFGCSALFMPGCFGNIRPQINGTFSSATKEQLDTVGNELAHAVCRAARYVTTRPASGLSAQEAELFLPFAEPKPMQELEQLAQDLSTPGHAVRAHWARRTIDHIRRNEISAGAASILQCIRIGPLKLLTIPGEPVQEIGYDIERRLSSREGTDDVLGYGLQQRPAWLSRHRTP